MNLKLLKHLSYSFIESLYIFKCLREQCANIIQRTSSTEHSGKDGEPCNWSLSNAVSDLWLTGGHFSSGSLLPPLQTVGIVTDRT